ncbi:MAG: TlpA family protein disulfide reductase [Candidatus Binatia bacterium]
MKRQTLWSLALVAALSFAALYPALRAPRGPRTAPSFVLPDLSGKVVRMDDFRGKVVLLNLWTTWCPPCVEEMPTLEALSRKMAGRDFVLLAISEDETPSKVQPWIEQHGFTFPVLLDVRAELGADLGITGYPETFVVDRQGQIVHHHIGFRNWAEERVVAAIERLMDTGEWSLG